MARAVPRNCAGRSMLRPYETVRNEWRGGAKHVRRARHAVPLRNSGAGDRDEWRGLPSICAGRSMLRPYEGKRQRYADGQICAKHVRRGRPISQPRLTGDLGAPYAAPLRNSPARNAR